MSSAVDFTVCCWAIFSPPPTPHYSLLFSVLPLGPQIEFGIVYSCIEEKMYTARKGKGAFCNGAPIKVSGQEGKE